MLATEPLVAESHLSVWVPNEETYPYRCPFVGEFLPRADGLDLLRYWCVKCPLCGKMHRHRDAGVVGLRADDESLVRHGWERQIYQRHFYHATAVADWYNVVRSVDPRPAVHVGSRLAAQVVTTWRDFTRLPKSYPDARLYVVKVNPSAWLDPQVRRDGNDWPELAKQVRHVVRYVNRFEAVGSVSLLVDPLDLDLVEVLPLDKHDVSLLLSSEMRKKQPF